jgi:putative hydrolase of the HAD superfamily
MKTIKALIFDMGGVLVDLDVEDCKNAFKSLLGYDKIDELIDPCHQKGIYGDLEEGTLSAEDFRKIVLADSIPGSAPQLVDQAMYHILVGIAPYKAEMLKKLSESYDLYMLSNNNPICLPRSRKLFEEAGAPLDEIFRKAFFSFEMKALKPSEAFYKAVVEEIGLPAEQMLFIDDSQKNVDGSIAAGLPAVYYEPGTDLSALIADVLGDPGIKMGGAC